MTLPLQDLQMRTALARHFLLLAIAVSVAGCSEHITGVAPEKPTLRAASGAQALLSVTCSAVVATDEVTCGNPASNDEVFSDVIIGGQNVDVRLTSSNATTSPGVDCPHAQVPDATMSCYSFDVSVTNLIPQPLGTSDTTSAHAPHANGVRVFFNTNPTSTGTGTVIVANPDGIGSFTATNQPYFQWNEVLATSAVTTLHHWEFQYTSDVTRFTFTVYVSTAVPYPNGYVDGLARVITMDHGDNRVLPGVSRTFEGHYTNAPIDYTSANPAVAVGGTNSVTAGMIDGATTLTALSGCCGRLRPGISSVWVSVCHIVSLNPSGDNFVAAIANTDCFAAFDPITTLPSTDRYGDMYRVAIFNGQTVTFSALNSLSGLDTYLIMADLVGNVIATNDDFGGGGSQITWTNNTGMGQLVMFQVTTRNPLDTGAYTVSYTVP